MGEERQLTEFTSTEQGVEDDRDADTADSDEAEDDAAEPATITYRWQPDGATCAQCGASTERQWRDDGVFVCPDCKSWQ